LIFLTEANNQIAHVDIMFAGVALHLSRERRMKFGEAAGDGHRVDATFAQQRLNQSLPHVHRGFEIDMRQPSATLQNCD
jgi:hypothetical protein